ncbi:hypothetical protein PoB_005133900, partial [Plakobranchus ocellatus]
YVHSGPGPGRARHGLGSPVREKKSCTDQSLLKITATFPSVHSSPGPALVFRAVFAPVAQAGFSPVVRVLAAGSSPAPSWSTIHAFMDPGNRVRHGRVTYGRVRIRYARSL